MEKEIGFKEKPDPDSNRNGVTPEFRFGIEENL